VVNCVPLRELGRYYWQSNLQRIVDDRLLATGDANLRRKCERAAAIAASVRQGW
jgi:hypothetical protein